MNTFGFDVKRLYFSFCHLALYKQSKLEVKVVSGHPLVKYRLPVREFRCRLFELPAAHRIVGMGEVMVGIGFQFSLVEGKRWSVVCRDRCSWRCPNPDRASPFANKQSNILETGFEFSFFTMELISFFVSLVAVQRTFPVFVRTHANENRESVWRLIVRPVKRLSWWCVYLGGGGAWRQTSMYCIIFFWKCLSNKFYKVLWLLLQTNIPFVIKGI